MLDKELSMENLDETLEFNPKNYIKCKTNDSRRICYKVILHLIK